MERKTSLAKFISMLFFSYDGGLIGNARRWIVGSAWPYVHFIPHLGNLVGSVLSADVFVRYLRLRGDDVVFVSGSDEHGTPIEVEALQLGIKPKELTDKMHEVIKRLFDAWEISFDNYTRTESEIHKEFVRKFFLKLYERGYIFIKEDKIPYCPKDKIFLPDRFIIGTCPYCNYDKARGDQCENCGKLLDPEQLINAKCVICGSSPEWRITKHWYLDLKKLENDVRKYLENNDNLPETAKSMCLGMIREGLKPRALTRDNKWGIEAPFPEAEGKTIYVWFEAVLGYISATIEYFKRRGMEDEWKKYWLNNNARIVFFVGKDNVPFHAIILPALLLASGESYTLPYTVASTEYLLYEGKKFSKSQRVGIWIDEALILMQPDYWRFILIMIRPETRDSSFTWEQAIEIVNSILNDTIGNFIHRVLSFIKSRFNSTIPEMKKFESIDDEYIESCMKIFEEATNHYEKIELKDAVNKIIEIARIGNKYLNDRKPWELIKKNIDEAGSVICNALHMVKMLAIGLYPVMPKTMSKLWYMMGNDEPIEKAGWFNYRERPKSGLKVRDVAPLFKKLSRDDVKLMIKKLEEVRNVKWSRKYPWEQVIMIDESTHTL